MDDTAAERGTAGPVRLWKLGRKAVVRRSRHRRAGLPQATAVRRAAGTATLVWSVALGIAACGGHHSAVPPPRAAAPAVQLPPGLPPGFHRIFNDNFRTAVPRGAFSDCNHNAEQPTPYCGGLSPYPAVKAAWWAYPAGWPDTATQRKYPVGGYYDPASTAWISGGQMHIRLWRGPSGPVHSAALVPKAAIDRLYGAFTETFQVSSVAPGYKSAHLLWPSSTCDGCEDDLPENSWNTTISAFHHPKGGGQPDSFDTGTSWRQWHTSMIVWMPGIVKFYLDGKLIGQSTRGVMDVPATWVIQNESSLDGESAAPNSSAQMNISSASVYAYTLH